jgi:hypothetical protein
MKSLQELQSKDSGYLRSTEWQTLKFLKPVGVNLARHKKRLGRSGCEHPNSEGAKLQLPHWIGLCPDVKKSA